MQRTRRRVFVAFFGPALALLGAITVAANYQGRGFGFYLRDLTAIAQIHPMAGVVSQIGALLWTAAVVACFLTASVLKQRDPACNVRFQVAAGMVTAVLLFDDLFQGHEYLAPRILGIGEHTVEVAYAIVIPAFLFTFRRQILENEAVLMGLAVGFLAASLAVDLSGISGGVPGLIEDGFKFLGITAWSAFFLRMAVYQLAGERAPFPGPDRASADR